MVRKPQVALIPVHFPLVRPGQGLAEMVSNCLDSESLALRQGDVVAVASKIVSACERRVVRLADVKVTSDSKRLSKRWGLDERLAALVLSEADEILGGVSGFLLTVKSGILTPNAGVDFKNSPPGTATLWPTNPDRSAKRLRSGLERKYRTRLGVEIVDSHVTALRLGTVGLAIGLSGFNPIRDNRGIRDLFGRPIRVTQADIADDIASATHLLMGESTERIGAVIVRGLTIESRRAGDGRFVKFPKRKCLIGSSMVSLK